LKLIQERVSGVNPPGRELDSRRAQLAFRQVRVFRNVFHQENAKFVAHGFLRARPPPRDIAFVRPLRPLEWEAEKGAAEGGPVAEKKLGPRCRATQRSPLFCAR